MSVPLFILKTLDSSSDAYVSAIPKATRSLLVNREIAILKTIAVLNRSIIKIILLDALIIGTSATFFGIFLGVMFSLYIEKIRFFVSDIFNISLFPEEIYFLNKMPSEIEPNSIFIISFCSIIITILVSIFPAIKASKLDPVKALKYE